jgi:hypothetical protein
MQSIAGLVLRNQNLIILATEARLRARSLANITGETCFASAVLCDTATEMRRNAKLLFRDPSSIEKGEDT